MYLFTCYIHIISYLVCLTKLTRTLGDCTPVQSHVVISKWENPDYFLYPDGDSDHPQNLMGSKLDQDQSSDFFLVLAYFC